MKLHHRDFSAQLWSEWQARYLRRTSAGQCWRCGKPATRGVVCARHYRYEKRRYEKRKRAQATT